MDWKKIMETTAPGLSSALTSPLAGAALKQLSCNLLNKTDGVISEIQKLITSGDSEVLEKLKNAEQEFQTQMKELNIDLERIDIEKRFSDRQHKISIKEKTPPVLALAVTIGFFGCLCALMFFEIPPSGTSPLQIMLGALGASWGSIIAYYFGSSAGSARKDGILAQKK